MRPAGHGPLCSATVGKLSPAASAPTLASSTEAPLAELSAASANCAAPSNATTLASCAAWWWRSSELWSCASASCERVASATAALSTGHVVASDAVPNSHCPCPITCCCCQRLIQSLARLDRAVLSTDEVRGVCSAWLCKEPRTCWRVMVRPISPIANTNSHVRHFWPAVVARRCWGIFFFGFQARE